MKKIKKVRIFNMILFSLFSSAQEFVGAEFLTYLKDSNIFFEPAVI